MAARPDTIHGVNPFKPDSRPFQVEQSISNLRVAIAMWQLSFQF